MAFKVKSSKRNGSDIYEIIDRKNETLGQNWALDLERALNRGHRCLVGGKL